VPPSKSQWQTGQQISTYVWGIPGEETTQHNTSLDAKGGRGAGKMANNRSEMKFKLRGNLIFDSSQH